MKKTKNNNSEPSVADPEYVLSLNPQLDALDRFLEEAQSLAEDKPAGIERHEEAAGKGQLEWIAAGLGQPASDLQRIVAGKAAGKGAGQVFFRFSFSGLTLAFRPDGLRAYIIRIEPALLKTKRYIALLKKIPFKGLDRSALRKLRDLSPRKMPAHWICISKGQAPVHAGGAPVEYLLPGTLEQTLTEESLHRRSVELEMFWGSKDSRPLVTNGCIGLTAVPGEPLARVGANREGQPGEDVFGRPVPFTEKPDQRPECGPHVAYLDGTYRATRYGYILLLNNTLSISSPLWTDAQMLTAFWVVLDEGKRVVSFEMIEPWLTDLGIVEGIQAAAIEQIRTQLQKAPQRGLFPIAAGTPPIDGQDGQVDILVDVQRRSGKERPDGSIDFHEVNFVLNVHKGQQVARRRAPLPGSPGRNLRGEVIPAQQGADTPLKPGDNIWVENNGDEEHFFALIEGVLNKEDDCIGVAALLQIKSDVSFHTGNLDFHGDIYVDGSVLSGFSVKTGGSLIITGVVEDSAALKVQGDLTVGKGILGRRTKVAVGNQVQAPFIQEAQVIAGANITLGSYAYQARLQAGDRVTVSRSTGKRGGCIIGGETWAAKGIECYTAGSSAETKTGLFVGLTPEQKRILEKITARIKVGNTHIKHTLNHFGLDRLDLSQIRNLIDGSSGISRRRLAKMAHQLGKLVQIQQELIAKRRQLERGLNEALKEAVIQIHGTAFSGVEIRLGHLHQTLIQDIKNPYYHIAKDVLKERKQSIV